LFFKLTLFNGAVVAGLGKATNLFIFVAPLAPARELQIALFDHFLL
jgi:hypothetical protein